MTYHEALGILRGVVADAGAAYRCLGCGDIWGLSGRSCECDQSAEGVDAVAALEVLLAQHREDLQQHGTDPETWDGGR